MCSYRKVKFGKAVLLNAAALGTAKFSLTYLAFYCPFKFLFCEFHGNESVVVSHMVTMLID